MCQLATVCLFVAPVYWNWEHDGLGLVWVDDEELDKKDQNALLVTYGSHVKTIHPVTNTICDTSF